MTSFATIHRRLRPYYPGIASFMATAAIVLTASAANAQDSDRVVLGVGAVVIPAYQGADKNRILPMPVIDIKKGWFVANLRNGIGIAPINTGMITVGASVVFIQGYRRRDVPVGIERLKDGVGARLFTNLRTGGFMTTIGVTKGISGGTEGAIADASISYPIPVSSKVSLTPAVGVTWADAKHNERYFGITLAESVASGLPQFSTGSGFKDLSAGATAAYRLTTNITLTATTTYTTLLGVVRNSPQIERKSAPSGFLTASYRF
ncbi:MipA/OmpV family protein [Sphingobium lactosutens]|uniref:MipA/OmpV family protein n=1 Tax=Sphingobium lactosutens TaxID=522773 RepID=UPI0015BA6E0A|nr:MipA/OmpV family protein [Sphingobium lactosutens]NWK94575.1 MipA/OmpV family protein [Sphingobium lactosutens]